MNRRQKLSSVIPFGYEVSKDDPKLLEEIPVRINQGDALIEQPAGNTREKHPVVERNVQEIQLKHIHL